MDGEIKRLLGKYAAKYEKAGFLEGDPSRFMHLVTGAANQEATAFVASGLSFGSRSQFLPRIQWLLDCASGDMDRWIRTGAFERDMKHGDSRCFYRFFTYSDMHRFFARYREIMEQHGSLGGFVRSVANGNATAAVEAICRRFNEGEPCGVVPKDPHSACKRVCMFLRWMVRTDSPVDLGLWADFIDRRTLVIPLDTHVVQEARRLRLLTSACTSMSVARRLTAKLAEVFPDDPCQGDFALFGYGVDESSGAKTGASA